MLNSVPENLVQCTFDFNALNILPIEPPIPVVVVQTPLPKPCSKCKIPFPATREFFYADKRAKDGFRAACKECDKKLLPPYQKPDEKPCSQCSRVFPTTLEFFHADNRARDGLKSECKECSLKYNQTEHYQEYKKQYDSEHYDPEYQHDYYMEHHEEKLAYQNSYTQENREKVRVSAHLSYLKHRARILLRVSEYQKIYSQTPRGRMVKRAAVHRRRARRRNAEGTCTPEQIQEQFERQKGRCYYARCGHTKFEKKNGRYIYHVDHIVPLSKGGTNWPDNLVLACPACNHSKGDKLLHEWMHGGRLC